MSKFIVGGGTKLLGSVRLNGAKNASYKLIIASILGRNVSRLLNVPRIDDVKYVCEIIEHLGGTVQNIGGKTLLINPNNITSWIIPDQYGDKSRSSTIFLGPLLQRFGKAQVPMPGGDKIGQRSLERHFAGLSAMGMVRECKDNTLYAHCPHGLKATTYCFEKNTHTGTETMILAGCMAEGKTILENCALEPEVDDLIIFLNKMGARIRRRSFRTIEIDGVPSLGGAIHSVIPDRNEAVTYACAALLTKGDIILENARHQDLAVFLEKVSECGGGYEIDDYGIRVYRKQALRATDITTEIHPGFMTDRQAIWAVLMCSAHGVSTIHETIFSNRFSQYVDILTQMGAKFELFNPGVQSPEKFYNFNRDERKETDFHAIKIYGPTHFSGGEFVINDLRAGATSLLAAMSASGSTTLHNIELIDRGYENIDKKLIKMGANITRVD